MLYNVRYAAVGDESIKPLSITTVNHDVLYYVVCAITLHRALRATTNPTRVIFSEIFRKTKKNFIYQPSADRVLYIALYCLIKLIPREI